MIRFLLDKEASVDFVNSAGRTVLQDAALDGNLKVFQLLMAHNPDLTLKDNYGRTVLFDAVEGGNLDLVKEVLNNIDDINVVDNNGQSALFAAALKDDQTIIKYLIEYGLDVNLLDNKRQNVMYHCVTLGATVLDTVEMLVDHGLKLNIKDRFDKTILDEILKILSILRDPPKKVEEKYRFVDAERNYLKLTTILIDNGLAVNRKDEQGKTVLYKEVERKNYETIEFLISSGADINAEDNDGKTLLFDACVEGLKNIAMIEYLFEKGIDLEHRDLQEKTIIDDVVEMILIQQNGKRASSRRYLDLDEREDYMGLLKRILAQRPKFNIQRTNGQTVLFDIITYNNLELIKMFLNNGADANVIDKNGNTPLSVLIDDGLKLKKLKDREQFLERIVFLLKFRVDINAVDKEGRTIFHKAVIANDLEVVEKLLTKKSRLEYQR